MLRIHTQSTCGQRDSAPHHQDAHQVCWILQVQPHNDRKVQVERRVDFVPIHQVQGLGYAELPPAPALDRQMFPTTQLVLELVFKEGRDVIDRNEDPYNKSGLIKARYTSQFIRIFGLIFLSIEIGFLLVRILLWKCIGGIQYIRSQPLVVRVIVCLVKGFCLLYPCPVDVVLSGAASHRLGSKLLR
jgi:hypothetical protein